MFNLIDSLEDLVFLNKELSSKPYIAVDTEFRRRGKEEIKLSLIQVNDSEETFIVDCLKIGPIEKICSFISSEKVTKIFHSYREDAEALYSWTNQNLRNVFDTQLANAFLGGSYSIGYRDLVFEKLGVLIDKDETRSNWLRRPLRDSQLKYAASDVQFLIELCLAQERDLQQTEKMHWFLEEVDSGLNKDHTSDQFEAITFVSSISKKEENELLSSFNKLVNSISQRNDINATLFFSKKSQKDFLRNSLRLGMSLASNSIPQWRKRLIYKDLESLFSKFGIT